MRDLFWRIAGTMFAVAVGAWVTRSTPDLWPLFALSILLGFVGWAVGTKEVRSRFRFLQTPAMRYSALHGSVRAARGEIEHQRRQGIPIDRPAWVERIKTLDGEVWEWLRSNEFAETEVRLEAPNFDQFMKIQEPLVEEKFAREGGAYLDACMRLIEKWNRLT